MNFYSDRKALADEYDEWRKSDPTIANSTVNVMSFLEGKGLLKDVRARTDIDKFVNLLNEFGVGYKEEAREEDPNRDCCWDFNREQMKKAGTTITMKEGYPEKHKNVGGYFNFYVCFEFDAEGNFIEVGIWE